MELEHKLPFQSVQLSKPFIFIFILNFHGKLPKETWSAERLFTQAEDRNIEASEVYP